MAVSGTSILTFDHLDSIVYMTNGGDSNLTLPIALVFRDAKLDVVRLSFIGTYVSARPLVLRSITSTALDTSGSGLLSSMYRLKGGTEQALRSGTITVAAVPEPASWALMVVGLGGLGIRLRARRLASI